MASQHTCSSASRHTEFHTASRGAQIAHSLRFSNQPLPQPTTQSMRIGVHQLKPFQSRSARISNKSSVSQLGGSVEECAICMMAMSDKCELDCSHKFCLGCVGEWFKTSKKCPLCRKRIHQYRSGSHLMAVAVSQSDSSFSLGSEWYSDQMSDASSADELVICQLCGESPFEEDLVIFCAGCQMSICHETCADLVGMGGPAWLCAGCQQ